MRSMHWVGTVRQARCGGMYGCIYVCMYVRMWEAEGYMQASKQHVTEANNGKENQHANKTATTMDVEKTMWQLGEL